VEKEIFLETAQRIGDRLVESAIWSDGSCTWIINTPDRKNRESRKSVKEQADVGIYQGVSGIALFLLELYRITGGSKLRKTIEAALQNVKLKSNELPNNNFAFHGGRVGVGYTFYEAYKVFQNEEYLKIGLELLKSLQGNESKDNGLDVIAGAAGTIPALLKMAEISNNEIESQIAIALGENLIKRANMETTGWSWGAGNSHIRNLCGYAHGAAGMGHAFIELYNFTGKEKFLYAAEQAFLYERQFFNKDKCNWSDFRYTELSEYLYQDKIEELKEVIKSGKLPPYENKYMFAWCHGAPGIALSRIRAYEITGHEAYKSEAVLAVEGTKRSLAQGTNYSLCHGIGGNCETLIYAAEILHDNNALQMAEEFAVKGIKEYEEQNNPWACGTMGGVSDPSLMLGEAGIGYYMLRLYSDKTDSILLVHPSKKEKIVSAKEGLVKLRESYTDTYFSKTKKYLKLSGGEPLLKELPDLNEMIGKNESDVERFYKNIHRYVDSLSDDDKNKFQDFFQLEKEKYLQTLEIKDFTEEFRKSLIKKGGEQINWSNSVLQLSKTSKLLEQKYNWPAWLENSDNGRPKKPDEDEQHYLLFKQNNHFHLKQLNPFLSLLFYNIQQPIEFENLVSEIKSSLESGISTDELREFIMQQLKVSYEADLILVTEK